ncbi:MULTISPECIES: helix-turn-helix domain-containing protein [Mycobacteroides]|uniref:helix-turn-helix domain-containing protein n=1 Tax=Mycobacteroides TaxID=670516 RepID=UPI000697CB72|nr:MULTISPECIES: hypothetical protein [Mycobacteroides]ANO05331.1 hypothetical protein BAB75_20030 [Mycobacteroides immunogenum]MCV7308014.1 hypothetical protein [Mycobacteroides immunogenum]ORV80233.1 hypothetical protein AWC10_05095 [Mycobacteroides immunogenum]SHP20791.1 Conserved protein of uncharacterised function, possible DNA binding protein [Mycobacteroides abscessus subsp. abscessus]SHP58920.1 Conserved protein of uncharacterised function, possible DNA binding protein [Mycobacteroides
MAEDDDWQQRQTAQIGAAIKALRGDRSAQWVSDMTADLGQRVTRSIITDIEIGRRKYVAVHELSLIAAALGVSPSHLLTWDRLSDGDVAVLPGRSVTGYQAGQWWGGKLPSPLDAASQGLPRDQRMVELDDLCRKRDQTKGLLFRARLGSVEASTPRDDVLIATLQQRLAAVTARIEQLGGTVKRSMADG